MWNSGKNIWCGFRPESVMVKTKRNQKRWAIFFVFFDTMVMPLFQYLNFVKIIYSSVSIPSTKFVLYRSAGSKSQVILLSRSTVRDMTHRFYYPQNTKMYIFTFYAFDFLERNVHWNTLSHLNNNLIMIIIIYISIS